MISKVFDQPKAGFVLLPSGVKSPPNRRGWQNRPYSFRDACTHRGNVGLLAGNGYISLDLDDPLAFNGLELPQTTNGKLGQADLHCGLGALITYLKSW